jgi:hypothetical protein
LLQQGGEFRGLALAGQFGGVVGEHWLVGSAHRIWMIVHLTDPEKHEPFRCYLSPYK